ncbi:Os03g0330900 [Oryza sativa Japonica Group]|uniref:Os03g0330900 protein n=1 Tax=Oryza sativa subsp. japonica TaxID=39947 RepID=A0A0P0VX05_ORYSJ|nr:Os03g0330900 [Oryza sativa Japonica Group]
MVAIWKLNHRPESTVETSDLSHSGIVSGCSRRRPRVGLAGAETAKKLCPWKKGCRKGSTSQSGFLNLGGCDAVGDESGGVTGALLETRSGGRLASPQRNGRRQEALRAAPCHSFAPSAPPLLVGPFAHGLPQLPLRRHARRRHAAA